MSPLWRQPRNVDKLLAESQELRVKLLATVELLDRFVEAFTDETEHDEQHPGEEKRE